jgi:hypothetical protein
MSLFKDISHFSKTSDYLPILNGTILVEIVVLLLTLSQTSETPLVAWYKTYRLSAVLADVLVVILGIIITRFLYPFIFEKFSIIKFIGLLLLVQTIHDYLFFLIFTWIPRGKNQMLDLFKDYSKRAGITAILGDNLIVIFSALFASLLANLSLNSNIILMIFTLYFIPYFLYIQ